MKVETNSIKPQPQTIDFFTPNQKEVNKEEKKIEKENKVVGQKEKIETNKKIEKENKEENKEKELKVVEEINEQIDELEKKIHSQIKSRLELTRFNEIAFTKKLHFRVIFMRKEIYLLVTNGEKEAIVSIIPPKWGGTSLRYLMTECIQQECIVVEKNTNKGKVLTYKQLVSSNNNDDLDIDIFD